MLKTHIKRDLELKLTDTSTMHYSSGFSETIEEGFSAKYIYDKDVDVEIDESNFTIKFIKDGVSITFGLVDITKKTK